MTAGQWLAQNGTAGTGSPGALPPCFSPTGGQYPEEQAFSTPFAPAPNPFQPWSPAATSPLGAYPGFGDGITPTAPYPDEYQPAAGIPASDPFAGALQPWNPAGMTAGQFLQSQQPGALPPGYAPTSPYPSEHEPFSSPAGYPAEYQPAAGTPANYPAEYQPFSAPAGYPPEYQPAAGIPASDPFANPLQPWAPGGMTVSQLQTDGNLGIPAPDPFAPANVPS